MSRFGPSNPITPNFMLGSTYGQMGNQRSQKRVVDGLPHTCADGHKHATESEVTQCIKAHMVHVCSSNHMHTEKEQVDSCDQLRREEQILKDKELQRQHEREMMDKQIKMADNLRAMGWNFQRNGMPKLQWTD